MPPFTAFYSDPHFFHKNVIRFCDRPFNDVEHMNQQLVELYNEAIGPDDFVLWCGDVSFGSASKTNHVLRKLNGRRALVIGNHDKTMAMLALGFEFVVTEMRLAFSTCYATVSHYPYALTEAQKAKILEEGGRVDTRYEHLRPLERPGEVLLHGHTHSKEKVNGTQFHIGVDAWDYKPAMWEQVDELIGRL